jgi:hypothetical protein
MTDWRVMPFWSRYYVSEEKKEELLSLIRDDAGEDYQTLLIESGSHGLRELIDVLPGMVPVLAAIDRGEIASHVRGVLETVVIHGFLMDRIREVLSASLDEAFGLSEQPEEQLLLTIVFMMFQPNDIMDPRLLEEPKVAALRKFVELVGEEGVAEALVGGADFIFHQCVGEIILRDETLLSFFRSRLPINFTYL